MSDVFISYTSDATPHAERLAQELRRHEISPFYDRESLTAGESWTSAIEGLLRSADAVVFLIGRQRGPWVEREWSRAAEESWSHPRKPMIPVVLQGATPPPFLRDRQVLHVRQGDQDWERIAEVIVRALRRDAAPRKRKTASENLRRQYEQRLRRVEKQASALEPKPAELLREAKTLERRLADELSAGDPKAGPTASRLADVMKSLGERQKAAGYLAHALSAYEQCEIRDTPTIAQIHANLATLQLELKRPKAALPHLEQAASLYREASGADSLIYGLAETRLAAVLNELGNKEAAAAHSEAGKRAIQQSLGNVPIIGGFLKQLSQSLTKRKRVARTAGVKKMVAGKKATAKKRTAKKTAAKKTTAKKPTAKKAAAKKTTAKKPTAKKTAAKKTTAKKPVAKKTATKKSTAKKPAAKKKLTAINRPARRLARSKL